MWTQKSWLLFNKVKQPPPYEIVSPLFHIGWGAEDMKAEFERQIKLGTTFQTVLTDGVELFGAGTRDRNFFMYLDGPDHVTIEVQSAMHHDFMHVHLLSDDPVAAAAWYEQHLGLTTRNKLTTVRAFRGIPTGPVGILAARRRDVLIVSRPRTRRRCTAGSGRGARGYASNRGRVLDHVARQRGQPGSDAGAADARRASPFCPPRRPPTACGRPSSRPPTTWSWRSSKATPVRPVKSRPRAPSPNL